MEYPRHFISGTKEYATHEKAVNAPLLRANFLLEDFQQVQLVICGLGFYRAFCNGTEITRGKLCSCPANSDQVLFYETYDLTALVTSGKNTVGIVLGNGMLNCNGGMQWAFDRAAFRSAPKTAFHIIADGNVIFSSDETVKTHPSPILYDDLREGESYDARLRIDHWSDADFDDRDWDNAITAQCPAGVATENHTPPVVVAKQWKALKIHKVEGGYIYEYPINTAGICRLHICGKAGQKITLQHVEVLDRNKKPFIGNIIFGCTVRIQRDEYTCCDGWQSWEPSFNYHGFRYVYVTGLTEEQATEETLIMLQMHSALERRMELQTSDPIINQLCAMINNSNLSNMLHFPTDCPQREKNGWAGDIAVSAQQMIMQYDMRGMLHTWLKMYCESQRRDGALPGYVPTGDEGYEVWTGPSWSMALHMCVELLYRYDGDLQITRECAETMERYLDYVLEQQNSDGLIDFGLGDWCQTTVYYADRYKTPREITDTMATLNMLQITARMFEKIGRPYERYLEIAQILKNRFREKWMDQDNIKCKCTSQTAQAMVIAYKVVDAEREQAAVGELVERVAAAGNVMDVGILGGYVLFDVLSDHGYASLAEKLILQEKAPSYGYFAARGETSLRESLMGQGESDDDSILCNGMIINSQNHHFWGFIYPWFVKNLAGVTINPTGENPNAVELCLPKIRREKIHFTYRFSAGLLCVDWEQTAGQYRLTMDVPEGIRVNLTENDRNTLYGKGKYIKTF